METKRVLLIAGGVLGAILLQTASARLHAEAQTPSALSGQVSSTEEGPMEGVVVTARKDGSTVSVSVVTNAQGRFAFPAARLEAGAYTVKVRAAGYELDGARSANIASLSACVLSERSRSVIRVSFSILGRLSSVRCM